MREFSLVVAVASHKRVKLRQTHQPPCLTHLTNLAQPERWVSGKGF